ncbi:hypothetical protein D9611_005925 [Ephemerocybe angulata]|uniref:Uncharacterized protein n=1 Tax=Ephemerocybe angulata TaxID=980116 RepID=A0A8H5CGB7_9AGAR|nr:hypothetical protein D9611_005925 [Tulosesus angulatus]
MEAHEQDAATEQPLEGTQGLGEAGKSGVATVTGKIPEPTATPNSGLAPTPHFTTTEGNVSVSSNVSLLTTIPSLTAATAGASPSSAVFTVIPNTAEPTLNSAGGRPPWALHVMSKGLTRPDEVAPKPTSDVPGALEAKKPARKPSGRPKKSLDTASMAIASSSSTALQGKSTRLGEQGTSVSVAVTTGKKSGKKSTSSGPSQTWKVIPTDPSSLQPPSLHSDRPPPVKRAKHERLTLKPRIWTSSKAELIAAVPSFGPSRCLNGVSWTHTETPMVLIDDSASDKRTTSSVRAVDIVSLDTDNGEPGTRFDLLMTRALVHVASSAKANCAPAYQPLSREQLVAQYSYIPSTLPLPSDPPTSVLKNVRFADDPFINATAATLGQPSFKGLYTMASLPTSEAHSQPPAMTTFRVLKAMDPGVPAPPPQLPKVPPPSQSLNAVEGSLDIARIKRAAQDMEEPRDRLAKFMDGIQASAEMLERKPDVLSSMVAGVSGLEARDSEKPDVHMPVDGGDVTMADPAAVAGSEPTIDTDPASLANPSGNDPSEASHPDPNDTSTAQLNAAELDAHPGSNPVSTAQATPQTTPPSLPCKCGKTWVMSNCPIHASVSGPTLHEILTSAATPRTEDAGERPKRKAASNSSAKVQELGSASKRQKRGGAEVVDPTEAPSPCNSGSQVKVTSVKVKVKRPSTKSKTDGVQMDGSAVTTSTGKKQANAKGAGPRGPKRRRVGTLDSGEDHDALKFASATGAGAGAGENGEGNLKSRGRKRKAGGSPMGQDAAGESQMVSTYQATFTGEPLAALPQHPSVQQSSQGPSQSHESLSQLSPPDPKQSDAPSLANPSISAYTQSNRSEAQPQTNDPHPPQAHAPLPSLPSEIRALIDAYVAGMPVVIVASRSMIAELFMGGARDGESGQKNLQKSGFGVPPKECGFGWLGLFRILGLEEKRIPVGSTVRKDRAMASAVACVQWRFRVEWMPGGEGIFKEDTAIGLDLSRPWWSIPPPPSGSGMACVAATSASAVSRGLRSSSALGSRLSAVAAGKQPERRGLDSPSVHLGSASESVSEKIGIETTTPELYLHARQAHPSYRSAPGTELYASLLPQPLLAEFNSFISNDVFPSGWFCAACGKVNFQVAMRHRKCQSMKCLQDNTRPVTTYAQDLADIRGPHSCSPCCLPFNDCSDSVLGTSTSWNNGMRTLSYYHSGRGGKQAPASGPAEAQAEEERKVWIKHVFTCNLAHLQKAASEMIRVLQTEVELRRNVEDASSPFFECAYDLSPSVSAAVPDCLVKAGTLLAKRASAYAEIGVETMEVSKLKVLAWMAPGKRMNQDVLRAKSSPVAVLCLGSDVVMCLSPQKGPEARKAPGSSKKGPAKSSASKKGKEVEPQLDLSSLIVMDESSALKEETSDGAQATSTELNMQESSSVEAPVASSSQPPAVTPVNKLAEGTVQVTMVHGDVLVLSGEDFTYSLKRSGTGILIFGMKAS